MSTTNVLAALMRKWPMNSAALVATTHRRFGKAANGTSTREVTCMINKWRAKINWKGIYNVRSPLGKGRMRAICMIFETFVTKHWRSNKNNKLLGWRQRTKLLTCGVGTVQYDDEIIKCKKTLWVTLNVKKMQSDVMSVLTNVTMELSNVIKN